MPEFLSIESLLSAVTAVVIGYIALMLFRLFPKMYLLLFLALVAWLLGFFDMLEFLRGIGL